LRWHLTLGTGAEIDEPTEGQIESALRELPGGEDSVAILGTKPEHFIQTAGSASEGFVLEYRVGSDAHHYRCNNPSLLLDEVLDAFLSYRRGDSEYARTLDWELRPASGMSWFRYMGLLILLGGAASVIWWWLVA
jgi:hypothetical protein